MEKVVIDTNVIIRYLINDHPELYQQSKNLLDLVKLGTVKVYIEQAVFTEIIFVLTTMYQISRERIRTALQNILSHKNFHNDEKDILIESLNVYVQTDLHIVDCIVAVKAKTEGIKIQSFDKKLLQYFKDLSSQNTNELLESSDNE